MSSSVGAKKEMFNWLFSCSFAQYHSAGVQRAITNFNLPELWLIISKFCFYFYFLGLFSFSRNETKDFSLLFSFSARVCFDVFFTKIQNFLFFAFCKIFSSLFDFNRWIIIIIHSKTDTHIGHNENGYFQQQQQHRQPANQTSTDTKEVKFSIIRWLNASNVSTNINHRCFTSSCSTVKFGLSEFIFALKVSSFTHF